MNLNRVAVIVMLLAVAQVALGAARTGAKPSLPHVALVEDYYHKIDANSLDMFVSNLGHFAHDAWEVSGRMDGLYYPKGTRKTCVYSAGIWIGAKVGGETRIAMAEYSTEFCPGPMEGGSYLPDQAAFKTYKIKRGDNSTTNPDWRDWPVSQGAPIDALGNPLLLGDMMTWSVCNDANASNHVNNSGGTLPLGVEIQQTAFAFARSVSLGNVIFMKFLIVNDAGNLLEDTYVSLWVDPDLGDAIDDLVGCDSVHHVGYCYNSGGDATYGSAPPAVGLAFLQGPMVPGAVADTAIMAGAVYPGYRNLSLSAFNRYVIGTDPTSPEETYNYMRGLNKDGTPVIDPTNGYVTRFVVSGDPVTGTGWLDATPADKRIMLNSGPFLMAPGDTQEVIVAIVVGQGSDAINSVSMFKQTTATARFVYEGNFDLAAPSPTPSLFLRAGDGSADVIWGSEPVDYAWYDWPDYGYEFEGFNLYQGEGPNGPWHKFATYDLDNEVALIYNDVYNPNAGGVERLIVQSGSNSGLRFAQTMTSSQLDGAPLLNGQPYYFAVTAYFYDHRHVTEFLSNDGYLLGHLTSVWETPIEGSVVIPTAHPGPASDTALHVAGSSDGMVIAEYLDLSQLTGHDYEVNFNWDFSWNLLDLTTGVLKLVSQTHQTPDFDFPVVDGMMIRTIGPSPGVGGWQWEGGTRWLTGEDAFGGTMFYGGLWNGPDFWGSSIDPRHDYVNVEIRFSRINTQKAYDYLRGGYPSYQYLGYFECPFTIWDVSSNPPRQLNAAFVENNGQPTYDSTWFPGVDGVAAREYLVIFTSDYSPNPDPYYTTKQLNIDASDMDMLYLLTPKIRVGHDPNTEFQEGQKLIILAAKPNTPDDVFRFHAGPRCGDADYSGSVDVTDAVFVVRYIFDNGAAPAFLESADANCDQRTNIVDVVYLVNYIFSGGPIPCADCGK